MIKNILIIAAVLASTPVSSNAQIAGTSAADAFLITRMADKFHVQPRPLNDELSDNFFNQILKQLDEDRTFFTREDLNRLQPYRWELDDQVTEKKTDFLQLLTSLYRQRIMQADTMIDNICKAPFNFSVAETFTAREDTSYPANTAEMRIKMYKRLKMAVLNSILDASANVSLNFPGDKKYIDSLEQVHRKKTRNAFKRSITRLLRGPGGVEQAVGDTYCRSLAVCYDPHTSYFSLTDKENFEIELGQQPLLFGFEIKQSEDEEGVEIGNLKPGSSAFKSGLLNTGDKILSLQWQGQPSIDVSNATMDEIFSILNSSNHDKLTISVRKADGTLQAVTLEKERTGSSTEEDKVKSFVLKGARTMGYIYLPAFYTDWIPNKNDFKGCANDVATEIVKLKKENIEGLILDLRNNGGGSMQEAIELSGIFIDAGPVMQVRSHNGKVVTLNDANRGTIYDGPLFILVNGYSASASEIVAGTLQDYNRALIIGSPTYGKATAQVVLPMDTAVDIPGSFIPKQQGSGFIKLTVNKLYRVNGTTVQGKGVKPDILLPDLSDIDPDREVNEAYALPASPVDPNKYYKPYTPLDVARLKAVAEKEAASSDYFQTLNKYIPYYKSLLRKTDVSLQWADAIQKKNNEAAMSDGLAKVKQRGGVVFTIQNNLYDKDRLQNDATLKEMNDRFRNYLATDQYMRMAFTLLSNVVK